MTPPRLRALTWNLFHGRDYPVPVAPGRLGRGRGVARARGSLLPEFASVLAGLPWDVALLQEAPPRWLGALGERLGSSGVLALTARNTVAPVRAAVADRRPHLLGSWEGGSNQLLVRAPWRIAVVERLTLTRRPERRRLLLARLERCGATVTVANLHASTHPQRAAAEARRAAEEAVAFAAGEPLLLGGDLNVRPAQAPALFAELEGRLGLRGATAPDAIDHLLARGLDLVEAPRALEPAAREVSGRDGRVARLSDHAPLVGIYRLPAGRPTDSAS